MNRALKILIAEDNVINQKVAVGALRSLGHTGVVVNDGEKALRCLSQLGFDALLLDVMMPVMDGLSTLAAIRERERLGAPHLIVIMATMHDEPGDRARFLAAGADGYVAKPIDVHVLETELNRLCKS